MVLIRSEWQPLKRDAQALLIRQNCPYTFFLCWANVGHLGLRLNTTSVLLLTNICTGSLKETAAKSFTSRIIQWKRIIFREWQKYVDDFQSGLSVILLNGLQTTGPVKAFLFRQVFVQTYKNSNNFLISC